MSVLSLAASTATAQGSDDSRVWYTLTNRVQILVAPNIGAATVGLIPVPSALCGLRSVGRFVEVRYVTRSGQVLTGYVERLRVDSRPLDPAQTQRRQEACAVRSAGASWPRPGDPADVEVGRTPATPSESGSSAPQSRPAARAIPRLQERVEEQFRLLAFAQEWYFNSQGEYSPNLEGLTKFSRPSDMSIAILRADTNSWSARIGVAGLSCEVSHSVSTGSVSECR